MHDKIIKNLFILHDICHKTKNNKDEEKFLTLLKDSVNIPTERGWFCLKETLAFKHKRIIKALLQAGASREILTSKQNSELDSLLSQDL